MISRTPAGRAYISGTDQAYIGRMLTMIASVRRFEPEASFHILCFDAATEAVFRRFNVPGVTAVGLSAILAFDPRLAASRADRTAHGFYDTTRGVLALYVMDQWPTVESVTWLDADLWFFSHPQAIFDEIGEAAIAISPHHYSPDMADKGATYGVFNSGLLHWKNNDQARRCINDYVVECLDWCDSTPNAAGAWLGQVYLNTWPDRYESLHQMRSPGVNLAYWNIANHWITSRDGAVWVDDTPLVFFHYSGVFEDVGCIWRTKNYRPGQDERATMSLLFLPYIATLDLHEIRLKRVCTGLRTATPPAKAGKQTPLMVSRPWLAPA